MAQQQSQAEGRETIHLVSTAGHPNFGDEYIAAAWLRFLAKARPDADVVFDCRNPGLATYLFEGLHPRARFTDLLWRVTWEALEVEDPDEAEALVDRLITDLGTPLYDFGLLAIRRATTIHLLGGGHLVNNWPHHARLVRAARRLGEVSGARLIATGLGLMPPLDPDRMRGNLAVFEHVSVRDQPSADLVGAKLVCDDAFLDVPNLAGFGERTGPTATEAGDVWVAIQADLSTPESFDAAIEGARELLQSPAFEGRTVRYLEAIPGGDRYAYDRLSDLIPEENFVPFVRLWSEGFPARRGQTWITTRFHFHLLAAACGADGVAVEINDDYYRTKHQSVIDLGSGWAASPAGSASLPAPAGSVEFRLTAGRMHRAKLDEAEALYPRRVAPRPTPAPAPVPQPQRAQEERGSGWFRRR